MYKIDNVPYNVIIFYGYHDYHDYFFYYTDLKVKCQWLFRPYFKKVKRTYDFYDTFPFEFRKIRIYDRHAVITWLIIVCLNVGSWEVWLHTRVFVLDACMFAGTQFAGQVHCGICTQWDLVESSRTPRRVRHQRKSLVKVVRESTIVGLVVRITYNSQITVILA